MVAKGDPSATDKLLPLVYEELRALARHRLAHEKPGQTLQPTALVHEAYLRLVGNDNDQGWDNRGHFFAAAAEAMRRILIENARRKGRDKRGGDWHRINFENLDVFTSVTPDQLVRMDEALQELGNDDPMGGELVKLRYFGGFSLEQSAKICRISTSTAYRHWAYARAWLKTNLCQPAS